MRWVTYLSPDRNNYYAGLVVENRVHGALIGLKEVIGRGHEAVTQMGERLRVDPVEVIDLASATLAAPIPVPPSIRDFMSFEEHVTVASKASGGAIHPDWYEIPTFYFSNPAAVTGPTVEVAISPGSSEFDYELEVAAIIGKGGSDITVDQAAEHIAGYTILCDWSARDLQRREMQQNLGPAKGKDSANSLGPILVTPDEIASTRIGKGYNLAMRAEVNGQVYSSGSWSTMYWSFEQLIAYASRGTVLRPGDVIGSGTVGTGCILELSGVHGLDRFPYLVAGDSVVLTVEQLGRIEATVTAGELPHPL